MTTRTIKGGGAVVMPHYKCTPGTSAGDELVLIRFTEAGEPVSAGVDPCIADVVRALCMDGLRTVASCCGHGHRPGRISLADGRELFVAYTREEADALAALYPLDIHGAPVRGGGDGG